MLIVTADDYGRSRGETDDIVTCYSRGRISAVSAMVFMSDSGRAADIAKKLEMPVGLHLNLSEPFTYQDVPDDLIRSHSRVCGFLKSTKYALVTYNPLLVRDFSRVVTAQLAEFRRLYGHDAMHLDGHQHMHLATNVLLHRLLPVGLRVRRNFSFVAGERNILNRLYRACVDAALARRHPVVDYFFALSSLLHDNRVDRIVALANRGTVELMTHPAVESERSFLLGDDFNRLQFEVSREHGYSLS